MSILSKIFKSIFSSETNTSSVVLEEVAQVSQVRTIEVKGMGDEKVHQTLDFIAENNYVDESRAFPQVSLTRNGGSVLLTLSGTVGFSDFANWVNNFVWADADGQRYEAIGHYPLGEARFNGQTAPFSHCTLMLFVPAEEDDPACIYFKTPDGESHRYDF